ncbi:hypothetical protein ABE096_10205 [Robertmurraya massiliosenegalensis]|uniref:hypothetical protein n=1 Tax=Robertmurraya TaxID=2837507 RepID=UPI0039A5619F
MVFQIRQLIYQNVLNFLKETINDTMDKINDEVSQSYSNRNFDRVRHFAELGEEINRYEQKIEQLIELLEVDSSDDTVDEELQEANESTTLPNYLAYFVDTNVEHTLYENFTHKRPFPGCPGYLKVV